MATKKNISFEQALSRLEEIAAGLEDGSMTLEASLKAYEEGMLDAVFGTNLTYRSPELLKREWFKEVDVSKYLAYFIASLNHDTSVSAVIDPIEKINALLQEHRGL